MGETQYYQGTCFALTGESKNQPVLVLIHGVGLNQDIWSHWMPVLTQHYRILTFDLLGHGGSHNPQGNRSILEFVNQLHGLVNFLDIDKVALCGYSLGAIIGLGYASVHRNRLTKLVLLHAVYQRSEAQRQNVRERYQITHDEGPMVTVELAISRWFSEGFRKKNPQTIDQIRQTFAEHIDDGYLKAYQLFSNVNKEMQRYKMREINCPTLVVTGEEDIGSTPAMSEALANELPDAELVINSGHRHGGPIEFADDIANQVVTFLNR